LPRVNRYWVKKLFWSII